MVEATNMDAIIAGGADDKEVITDAAVYQDQAMSGENASGKPSSKGDDVGHAMRYSVKDPKEHGGHIVYDCSGFDSLGEWQGLRRFNEFFVLH